jgi:hypothetical protein
MRILIAIGLVVALEAGAAGAAVTVRTAEGRTVTGVELGAGAGKITLSPAGGTEEASWAVEDVARVELSAEPPAVTGSDVGWVYVSGGVLRGTAKTFDGDNVVVTSEEFGEVKLPVAGVEFVVIGEVGGFQPQPLTRPFGPPSPKGEGLKTELAQDLLVLANGDRVSGTLNRIEGDKFYFHGAMGDLTLERGRVKAIQFAAPVAGRPTAARPAVRLVFGDGAAAEVSQIEIGEGKVRGLLCGAAKVEAPLSLVVRMEVVGGRLTALETLTPGTYEQRSLDILKWEIVPGKNVLGGPMKLREKDGAEARTFEAGLGVHGPCRMVYHLDGGYERFLALAGVDESAGALAEANLVVKVDGKEAFRADHVKWKSAAREVSVNVAGAKELELAVEAAGEHFDVQNRVDWAEARLLRSR